MRCWASFAIWAMRFHWKPAGQWTCPELMQRVIKVLDLKTPGSGEVKRNLEANIAYLNRLDQVKFVICDREDYEWACAKVEQFKLTDTVDDVLFSPSNEELEARELAEWVLADQLDVRLQVQLHKYLWDNKAGH